MLIFLLNRGGVAIHQEQFHPSPSIPSERNFDAYLHKLCLCVFLSIYKSICITDAILGDVPTMFDTVEYPPDGVAG